MVLSLPNRHNQMVGKTGEAIAKQVLEQTGYHIIDQNWRMGRQAEIDMVATIPNTVVFVEVKTRSGGHVNDLLPHEAVTPSKQRKLVLGARYYLQQHPEFQDFAVRFDVVAITLLGFGFPANINHITGAFTVDD
jgi:putative endonuclease